MQTDIHGYTDKQADRKIQRDKQAGRKADIHSYMDKQADRKIQRDKQAGRQRYTVTLTNRQI